MAATVQSISELSLFAVCNVLDSVTHKVPKCGLTLSPFDFNNVKVKFEPNTFNGDVELNFKVGVMLILTI